MAREFKEKAHLNTDTKKYINNYEKIFGKRVNCEKCNKKSNCKIENNLYVCESCKETLKEKKESGEKVKKI